MQMQEYHLPVPESALRRCALSPLSGHELPTKALQAQIRVMHSLCCAYRMVSGSACSTPALPLACLPEACTDVARCAGINACQSWAGNMFSSCIRACRPATSGSVNTYIFCTCCSPHSSSVLTASLCDPVTWVLLPSTNT